MGRASMDHVSCCYENTNQTRLYYFRPHSGRTAIISLVQNLRPRLFPLIHLQIPATTTLLFQDSPIGPMIYSQQDSWTLEGIVQSMPLLGWWYDNVVR